MTVKQGRFLLWALCLTMLLGVHEIRAAGLYTVSDVKVAATAADATEARAKAMQDAEKQAYDQVMQRLVEQGMLTAPVEVQPHQISSLVTGYEVQSEKIGPKSYHATLTVNFDPSMLSIMGAAVAPAPNPVTASAINPMGEPVNPTVYRLLVVPAMRTQGGILLWDVGSPWSQAWQQKQNTQWGKYLIIIPAGDSADQQAFTTGQLQAIPPQSLQQLAARYQAHDVVVADASLVRRATGRINLDVKLTRLAAMDKPQLATASAMDVGDALFQIATDKVLQSLPADVAPMLAHTAPVASQLAAQPLPYNTPTPSASLSRIKLLTPLESIRQWAGIRRKLESLPMVESVQVSAMTTRQADAYVAYTGSVTALSDALQAEGYRVQRQNSYWVLQPN